MHARAGFQTFTAAWIAIMDMESHHNRLLVVVGPFDQCTSILAAGEECKTDSKQIRVLPFSILNKSFGSAVERVFAIILIQYFATGHEDASGNHA